MAINHWFPLLNPHFWRGHVDSPPPKDKFWAPPTSKWNWNQHCSDWSWRTCPQSQSKKTPGVFKLRFQKKLRLFFGGVFFFGPFPLQFNTLRVGGCCCQPYYETYDKNKTTSFQNIKWTPKKGLKAENLCRILMTMEPLITYESWDDPSSSWCFKNLPEPNRKLHLPTFVFRGFCCKF